MDTADDVTTLLPSILMIEGREHVLYQGSMSRIRVADARLLWLNTARVWAITVYAILSATNAARPNSSLWLAFVAFAAICGAAALSMYMENRGLLTVPHAVAERESTKGPSTLAITSKSQRLSSGRLPTVQFAAVHPEMAEFLLTAFAEGQSRRFRQRPRVPGVLTTPSARLQSWAETVGVLVALVAIVVIVVAIVIR